MQGDFSRMTFDPTKHFAVVLAQQGRVGLDADLNENALTLLHYLRTVVRDIVGPCAHPFGAAAGFSVSTGTSAAGDPDLAVSNGRMYVDGILVENDYDQASYWHQPDGYLDPDVDTDKLPTAPYLVYLRVFERLITALQDGGIREVALGDLAPDTSARSQVVWQLAAAGADLSGQADGNLTDAALSWIAQNLRRSPVQLPRLQAQVPPNTNDSPCDLAPDSRYRGPENQLYRVEIHTPGRAQQPGGPIPKPAPAARSRAARAAARLEGGDLLPTATFKFSRENASVAFAIESIADTEITLADLGRDLKLGLEVGDWVEIVDDAYDLRVSDDFPAAPPPPLRRVLAIDPAARLITVDPAPADSGSSRSVGTDPALHPLLRRWDHPSSTRTELLPSLAVGADGALPVVEDSWIDIEDGIQVRFVSGGEKDTHSYRRGDYWWIPARTIPGTVLWPQDDQGPVAATPDGVQYHYAPLAWVDANGGVQPVGDEIPTPHGDLALTTRAAAAPAKRAPRRARSRPAG